MADLIVIKTFFHRHEAEVAKGLLKEQGIEAVISSDDAGGYRPHLTLGMGNVRLLVSKPDAERAGEILKVLEVSGGKLLNEDVPVPPPRDEVKKDGWKLIFIIAGLIIAGIILAKFWVPLQKIFLTEPAWKDSFKGGTHIVLRVNAKEDTAKALKILKNRLDTSGIYKDKRIVKQIDDTTILIQLPLSSIPLNWELCSSVPALI